MRNLFFILLLALGFGAVQAQNKTAPKPPGSPAQMLTGTWLLDSAWGESDEFSRIEKDLADIVSWIVITPSGKVLMKAEKETILMQYEVLESKNRRYFLLSGMIMLYMEIKALTPNSVEFYFELPRMEVGSVHLRFKKSEITGVEPRFYAGYFGVFDAERDSVTAAMWLSNDSTMHCNFGEPDSGTWFMDEKTMLLTLKGKNHTYKLEPEFAMRRGARFKMVAGPAKGMVYEFRRSDRPYEYAERVDEVTEMDVEAPVEADKMEASDEVAEPRREISTIQEGVYGTWVLPGEKDVWFIFDSTGKVTYKNGKKEFEGTWSMEHSNARNITIFWKKRPELASFYIANLYAAESVWEMNITLIPPDEDQVRTYLLRRPAKK